MAQGDFQLDTQTGELWPLDFTSRTASLKDWQRNLAGQTPADLWGIIYPFLSAK